MSEKKYEIKLVSNKILDPLREKEISSLLEKGTLNGNEEYREEGENEWRPISSLLKKT